MLRFLKKFLLFLIVINLHSSAKTDSTFTSDKFSIKTILTTLPPFFLKNIHLLKEYIRSDEFVNIRKITGDISSVDSIYQKSLKLTENNIGFALLISAIATFDHYSLHIKFPLINFYLPISNETKIQFEKRLKNLPSHFLPDSPKYPYGDKDKLQHIFGSAFLVYVFETNSVAERYSIFVEKIEDRYISDGTFDLRDIEANRIGQEFGFMLLKNKNTKPSEVINNHYKKYENNINY